MVDLYITIIFSLSSEKTGLSAGPRSSACCGPLRCGASAVTRFGAGQSAWIELNQRQ